MDNLRRQLIKLKTFKSELNMYFFKTSFALVSIHYPNESFKTPKVTFYSTFLLINHLLSSFCFINQDYIILKKTVI